MVDKKLEELLQKLKSLDLPSDDFAVFGSGPIIVRGLRPFRSDLDIIARGEAWEKVKKISKPVPAKHGGEQVRLFDGMIEFMEKLNLWDLDEDELIDTADVIDGIRFVKLKRIREFKEKMGREKDKKDIELIDNYLEKNGKNNI